MIGGKSLTTTSSIHINDDQLRRKFSCAASSSHKEDKRRGAGGHGRQDIVRLSSANLDRHWTLSSNHPLLPSPPQPATRKPTEQIMGHIKARKHSRKTRSRLPCVQTPVVHECTMESMLCSAPVVERIYEIPVSVLESTFDASFGTMRDASLYELRHRRQRRLVHLPTLPRPNSSKRWIDREYRSD